MNRRVLAFAVTPLCIENLIYIAPPGESTYSTGQFLFVYGSTAAVAYVFALGFGLPAFFILRARGYTQFWLHTLIGGFLATSIWFGIAMYLGASPLGRFRVGIGGFLLNYPFDCVLVGLLGAATMAAIWLIKRPDRYVREKQYATETSVF